MPNTYYISPSGNDTTGNGSSGNPWLTLAKAYASSTTNDTIECAGGTYTFATATMLTARTLKAADGATVIFDGASADRRWGLGGNWTMTDIKFQNIVQTNSQIYPIIGYLNISGVGTCTLTRCTFASSMVRSDAEGYGGVLGTFVSTGAFVLNNCLMYGITPVAGYVYGAIFKGGNLTVTCNNTTIAFTSLTDNFILMPTYSGGQSLTFENSVVYNGTAKEVTKNLAGTVATYSDFHNTANPPVGTGVIYADPKLVDPANGNFALRPDSPCLDSGVLT